MKKMVRIIILILTLTFGMIENSEVKFPYETILDHDNKVQLKWNIKEKIITFNLILIGMYSPADYLTVGFGMSDRGKFDNAKFILFEIDLKKSLVTFFEAHTDSEGKLNQIKKDQNIYSSFRVKSITENRIELIFERNLITCNQNDYQIEGGTVHLLHFVYKHRISEIEGFKPTQSADLFDMKQTQLIKSTYFNTNVKLNRFINILNNNIRIPATDTTYWCKVYKLPEEFVNKHHITAFESVITEASKGIVHHMEVFHCVTDPRPDMTTYDGPCNSEAKPDGLIQCRKVIAAWAMGANRFVYPSNVGGVIGGKFLNKIIITKKEN